MKIEESDRIAEERRVICEKNRGEEVVYREIGPRSIYATRNPSSHFILILLLAKSHAW